MVVAGFELLLSQAGNSSLEAFQYIWTFVSHKYLKLTTGPLNVASINLNLATAALVTIMIASYQTQRPAK